MRLRPRLVPLALLAALNACDKGSPSAAPAAPDAPDARTVRPTVPPPAPPADAARRAAAPAPAPAQAGRPGDAGAAAPLVQRPGGPTVASCAKAAERLAALVEDSALAPTTEQRAYLERVLSRDHDRVVRYCVEVAVPREIACLLAAKDVTGIDVCDRFRRQLPADLLEHRELTREDCERFYDRLRGFKIEEGAVPEDLDKDREQIVRACQEKARVGTVACFIASPTYAQARRCP